MDEELTKRLNEGLEFVMQSVTETKDFVVDQAQQVAHEIVKWYMGLSITMMIVGIIMMVASLVLTKKWLAWASTTITHQARYECPKEKQRWVVYEPGPQLLGIPVLGLGVAGFIVLVCNTVNLVYVLSAPRLVVLDYIRSLL